MAIKFPPGYLIWERWVERGRKPPRPASLPRRIPQNWWSLYAVRHPRALEAVKPPPPTVPETHPAERWQRYLVLAQPITDAFAAPAYYRIAVTADPSYDQYARRDHADAARQRGMDVAVWYVPTQVSKERADEVAVRLGTTIVLGQAETASEFDASVAHGRKCVIGNPHALRDDQLPLVRDLKVGLIAEDYWNSQPWSQRDYRHLPVAAGLIAVYDAHSEHPDTVPAGWHPDVDAYKAAGRLYPGDGLYGPGATNRDFAALP